MSRSVPTDGKGRLCIHSLADEARVIRATEGDLVVTLATGSSPGEKMSENVTIVPWRKLDSNGAIQGTFKNRQKCSRARGTMGGGGSSSPSLRILWISR